MHHCALRAASVAALALPGFGQGAAFQTPGMPAYPAAPASTPDADPSQTSRFSSVFNPAFSFIVDTTADYTAFDGDDDDGFALELRTLELAAQSWVDPKAWAYFVGATDGESLNIEEAALHYTGFGGNTTLRAGRFFVDFGKQMQIHVHELRTIDRPLVLRTYLGDEIKGDGLQWDDWFSAGDDTAVRWSIGAFQSLLPEESEDFDATTTAEQTVDDRKKLGDLHFTARITAFTDAGDSGTFQLGASARLLPEYSFEFEPSGDAVSDLSNEVYGVDATYGTVDDTGEKRWTFGAEYLQGRGDTGSAIDDAGTPADPSDDTITVLDDSVGGYYAFADYAWDRFHSAGVQYSRARLADGLDTDVAEADVYYTRLFSEFHRLRFAATALDSDADDADSVRIAIQYTAFIGAHGHGVNW